MRSAQELAKQFDRARLFQWILVPLLISGILAGVFFMVNSKPSMVFWIMVLGWLSLVLLGTRGAIKRLFWGAIPIFHKDASHFLGSYSQDDIRQLIHRILEANPGWEEPSFYVLPKTESNAFAINHPFLNSNPKINAVYISHRFFHILKTEELAAVLGHEMGHFRKYMYPINRLGAWCLLGLVGWMAYGSQFFGIPWESSWWMPLIFFLLAPALAGSLISLLSDSQLVEHLCDAQAVRTTGLLPTINALIQITHLQEDIFQINRLLLEYWFRHPFPPTEFPNLVADFLDERKRQRFLPGFWDSVMLRKMKEGSFDELKKYRPNEVESKNHRALLDKLKSPGESVLDWDSFDQFKRDGVIQKEELQALTKALHESGERNLFPGIRAPKAKKNSHPQLKKRLLFIIENFSSKS